VLQEGESRAILLRPLLFLLLAGLGLSIITQDSDWTGSRKQVTGVQAQQHLMRRSRMIAVLDNLPGHD
jgi:hypothetical protein